MCAVKNTLQRQGGSLCVPIGRGKVPPFGGVDARPPTDVTAWGESLRVPCHIRREDER